MPPSLQRIHAESIFAAAIDAVRPAPLVQKAVLEPDFAASLAKAHRVIVIGGGKAAAGMVAGLEAALVGRLESITGIVNVPDGCWQSTRAVRLNRVRPMGMNEPTPNAAIGVDEMLALIGSATSNDVALVLLSGGASALLPAPVERISLEDKIQVTRALSAAGASINDLNCVRKHLSRIKGGRLADAVRAAASVWSLIISDVVGNPLDVIASGPTAADPTTYGAALAILRKFDLIKQIPTCVVRELELGQAGWIPETPKLLAPNVYNRIIACNEDALLAAKTKARKFGYDVVNLGNEHCGDTTELARRVSVYIPDEAIDRPLCILLGGETTVNLGSHQGKGGRNQEFVLALANEIKPRQFVNNRLTILSGGTDGEDGPTDAAGAIWDAEVANNAVQRGLEKSDFLRDHNSYWFFKNTGGLLQTGLTGTNVMDIRIVLIGDIKVDGIISCGK